MAAGTSTGGMTGKRWGRVGDAPVIGAGTYADNRACAVSATGWGEYFLRVGVAHEICARLRATNEVKVAMADEGAAAEGVRTEEAQYIADAVMADVPDGGGRDPAQHDHSVHCPRARHAGLHEGSRLRRRIAKELPRRR